MIPRSQDEDPSEPREGEASASIVRRFGRRSRPEDELERVLADRRSELEDYATRFEESALDLGRREQALEDERASIDRLLRTRTAELDAREKELVQFERGLDARDQVLQTAERELAERRSDLGAVELKRAALEQRERTLERREAEIAEHVAPMSVPASDIVTAELFFVPGSAYRLIRAHPTRISIGGLAQVDGERYRVARVGSSPLPGDERQCAYLAFPGPAGESDDSDS